MRFKFFPGSELGPPELLGGIVDLDRPQHVVANVFLGEDNHIQVRPLAPLSKHGLKELELFAEEISVREVKPVPIEDIMYYTSRRRAMC